MNFEKFRKEIKSCKICKFKQNHPVPFYFNCKSPEKVKCIIITEQPRIRKNQCDCNEDTVIDDFTKPENIKSDTIKWLIKNFDNERAFTNSIKDEAKDEVGVYYWTHYTKCPSNKREFRKKCFKKWFKEENELKLFPKLSTIITLGAKPYRGIVSISDDHKKSTFYDYFWKEIEMIVNKEILKNKLKITIGGENYTFIALPHPSGANPLSKLLEKCNTIIDWIKHEF